MEMVISYHKICKSKEQNPHNKWYKMFNIPFNKICNLKAVNQSCPYPNKFKLVHS